MRDFVVAMSLVLAFSIGALCVLTRERYMLGREGLAAGEREFATIVEGSVVGSCAPDHPIRRQPVELTATD